MDHAIVIFAQITQKGRQHGRGVRLGIVQQDDALAGDFEPLGQQLQFLLSASSDSSRWPRGRRRTPRCPAFAADRASPASLETGKAEERRARRRGRDPVKRHFDRRDAVVDFVDRLRSASSASGCGCVQVWWPMVWPSAAILRTSSGCSEAGLPIRKNVACTHSCASAASTFGVVGRPRPVVEGQHHLVVLQRQRLRKTLQADAR